MLDNFGAVNFALVLFWLTVITGIMYVLDLLIWRKKRLASATEALARFDASEALSIKAGQGEVALAQARKTLQEGLMRQPWWLEYTASFFPVIAAVFFLRSFVAEPFRIPSGSMIPTLMVGDLILVKKYSYGIRLPILNRKLFETDSPQRGDVMVFRYPLEPDKDYIKRVVGLPGDEVEYSGKQLKVNGELIVSRPVADFVAPETMFSYKRYSEKLGAVEHDIIVDTAKPSAIAYPMTDYGGACQLLADGIRCKVPTGKYFMMGDNRDNSQDSRFWGFVPDENVVGKAFFIWMNFSNISRIGGFH